MTVFEKKTLTNLVPAVAVIREVWTLPRIIGCKAFVDC
jgi:hypothetical protein